MRDVIARCYTAALRLIVAGMVLCMPVSAAIPYTSDPSRRFSGIAKAAVAVSAAFILGYIIYSVASRRKK